MEDELFTMTADVNGKPIPRWQERLEQMYTAGVPFGEILSLVRYLVAERDIEAILSAPDDVILAHADPQAANEIRQKFDTIARLTRQRDELLAACEAYMAAERLTDPGAYLRALDALPIQMRAAIAKARGTP
jgi:hypothetical protein